MSFLNDSERNALIKWVEDRPDQSAFQLFLGRNGVSLAEFASINEPLPLLAFRFHTWLEQDTQRVAPLLRAAADSTAQHESAPVLLAAAARATRILEARAPKGDAWDAPHVDGVPVINRSQLREVLKCVAERDRPPVVLINGAEGSGRTHSFFLIKHVAKSLNIKLLTIRMDDYPTDEQTLQTVFARLVALLRLKIDRPPTSAGATPDTVGGRHARAVADALAEHDNPVPAWIVFDSIDRPLPPELKSFVCQLAHLRLRTDLENLKFFLLGAGQDFGVEDPHRLAAVERLAGFHPDEIRESARALNAAGARPLKKAQLQKRIEAMVEVLGGQGKSSFVAVAELMAQLRQAVDA